MARAAGEQRPRGTTLALVLASNLPDVDVVLMARSDATYLLFHRGITHSILGLAVLPPLLAAALWWGLGRRTSFRWLLLACWLGALLHVLYDVLTPWGTMLLYPFSVDRHALDWLFIVDPMTWAAPAAALLVARRHPQRSRAAAIGFLAIIGLWTAGSGLAHHAVRRAVAESEHAAGRPVAETFAFPRPGAPWRWFGIAAAPDGSPEPQITRYAALGLPPELGPPERIERGFGDPWSRRALDTRPGQAYLWWAAVPVARAEARADSVVVTLSDLRFRRSILPAAESWVPFTLRLAFDARTGTLRDVSW